MDFKEETERDLEKNPAEAGVGSVTYEKRPSYVYEDGAVPQDAFGYGTSVFAKAQRLAGKFKIEQRGIERVPEDERTDHSLLNVGSMVSSRQTLLLHRKEEILAKKCKALGWEPPSGTSGAS